MENPDTLNIHFIDELYSKWKANPDSVTREWQLFFKGFEVGYERPSAPCGEAVFPADQSRVDALIHRYRDLGHLLACMDPLTACPIEHPLLTLESFQLKPEDLDQEFYTGGVTGTAHASLKEIIRALKETYCRSVGVEYLHLQDPDERRWLQERMEPVRNRPTPDREARLRILNKLIQAALFEQFLNKKYVGVTRFSLEGGDALIPLMDTLIRHAAGSGCREMILGMAHRGRLNVQAHILGKPYEEILGEFESCYDPEHLIGAGDVKYHNGFLSDVKIDEEHTLRLFLMNNPSHLEAVNPVVEGFCRARQDLMGAEARKKVLPVLIHGDAAFAGQGVVAETLNMSQLEGYATGGTVHIIINNQIGYTTLPKDARSTRYSTDVAKMLMVPIFHVHGEDPEAVVYVAALAAAYRSTFHKDVVIDLICYRRYGHNEGDEPYFTQPRMYDRIRQRPPVYTLYAEKLREEGAADKGTVESIKAAVNKEMDAAYQEVHGSSCPFPENRFYEAWDDISGKFIHDPVSTVVEKKRLLKLSEKLNTPPPATFSLHPKLKTLLKKRKEAVASETGIDWANSEALAFASLLEQEIPVRLSGQDVGRGTFSQRHSVLFDRKNGDGYIPLNHLSERQAPYSVYNSLLAEAGVLGFEYGYSVADPRGLILWEAQFGDFVNNAQGIIDLFIASGQSKWRRLSALVMLLPHGWEGLGPEHSSARLERFLQLCADDNMQVANPTLPAQYFHLLRRQVLAPFRIPLIVMTPKSLLRHPLAVSRLSEFTDDTFHPVLDDPESPAQVRQVLLCSGKIFYQLIQRRRDIKAAETAIVRLEQLYPFPEVQLNRIVEKYSRAASWTWVQEEPENMGAWWFLRPRLEQLLGRPVRYVGRKPAASPATGFPVIYKLEQNAISDQAVGPFAGVQEISG